MDVVIFLNAKIFEEAVRVELVRLGEIAFIPHHAPINTGHQLNKGNICRATNQILDMIMEPPGINLPLYSSSSVSACGMPLRIVGSPVNLPRYKKKYDAYREAMMD